MLDFDQLLNRKSRLPARSLREHIAGASQGRSDGNGRPQHTLSKAHSASKSTEVSV